MSVRLCRLFLFGSLLLMHRISVAAVWDLYSENLGATREDLVSSQTRLRVEGLTGTRASLIPYLTGGYELMTAGLGRPQLDTSSHAFAGLGLRVPLSGLQFRLETRFRAPLNDVPKFRPVDVRASLVYGNFLVLSEPDPIFAFVEPYSEALFTSSDSNNLILNAYTRLGIRTPLEKAAFDIFLEPFVSVDTRGHFYNNRLDLKLAARLSVPINPLTFSLSMGHQWNHAFTVREANPYLGKDSGWRFLAVLGGLL